MSSKLIFTFTTNPFLNLTLQYTYSNRNQPVTRLYVGAITFFFEYIVDGVKCFLVLIDVAKEHGVVSYDKYTPEIKLRPEGQHKFVVCRFEDIICNVGLLKCKKNTNKYKVISHHIFKQMLHTQMWDAKHL